jgi:hypothetical protein
MLLLVLEIENKNTIHWIHQFVVRLTHKTQENWFSTNKTCYTVHIIYTFVCDHEFNNPRKLGFTNLAINSNKQYDFYCFVAN